MFSWNCFHSDLNFYRDLNQATHLSRKLVFAADWRSTEQGTKSHLCFILHSCAGSSVTDIGSPWPWPGPDPGWWRVPRWGRAGPVRTRTSSCPHDAPVESFKSLSEPRSPCTTSTGIIYQTTNFHNRWRQWKLSLGSLAMCVPVHDPSEKKFPSSLAGGLMARKYSEIFLTRTHWQGVLQIFPRRGQSCLAKMLKFLPKCANASPWWGKCHYNSSPGNVGKKKAQNFPRRVVHSRKKSGFFYPRNSCKTPPYTDLSCQMVSRGKNAVA